MKKRKAPPKQRKKPKKAAPKGKRKSGSDTDKMEAWLSRLSPKAQERIRKEGYHLPVRSEQEQLEGLTEELLEAFLALRARLMSLGEQEVRTSHRSIMFARNTCYLFVRPKRAFIEVNLFLPRTIASEFLKKVTAVSKTKWVHILHLTHADQVDLPLTDWIKEAFEFAA